MCDIPKVTLEEARGRLLGDYPPNFDLKEVAYNLDDDFIHYYQVLAQIALGWHGEDGAVVTKIMRELGSTWGITR